MFTRSGAASARPEGGRRVLQRDGALGTCAERAGAPAGSPQPKRRPGTFPGRFPGRDQKAASRGKHPAAQTLRGARELRPSTPHLLQPDSSPAHLPALPFCVYPRVRGFLPSVGALFQLLPGAVAASPCTHLPWSVAVPLVAGGSAPNDANCTLEQRGGEPRGRAGGRTRAL